MVSSVVCGVVGIGVAVVAPAVVVVPFLPRFENFAQSFADTHR